MGDVQSMIDPGTLDHESFDLWTADLLKRGDICIKEATVKAWNFCENTVDIELPDLTVIEDVEIFYHCQHSKSANGGIAAMELDAEVIYVEYPKDGDTTLGEVERKVIGFKNQLRYCYKWILRIWVRPAGLSNVTSDHSLGQYIFWDVLAEDFAELEVADVVYKDWPMKRSDFDTDWFNKPEVDPATTVSDHESGGLAMEVEIGAGSDTAHATELRDFEFAWIWGDQNWVNTKATSPPIVAVGDLSGETVYWGEDRLTCTWPARPTGFSWDPDPVGQTRDSNAEGYVSSYVYKEWYFRYYLFDGSSRTTQWSQKGFSTEYKCGWDKNYSAPPGAAEIMYTEYQSISLSESENHRIKCTNIFPGFKAGFTRDYYTGVTSPALDGVYVEVYPLSATRNVPIMCVSYSGLDYVQTLWNYWVDEDDHDNEIREYDNVLLENPTFLHEVDIEFKVRGDNNRINFYEAIFHSQDITYTFDATYDVSATMNLTHDHWGVMLSQQSTHNLKRSYLFEVEGYGIMNLFEWENKGWVGGYHSEAFTYEEPTCPFSFCSALVSYTEVHNRKKFIMTYDGGTLPGSLEYDDWYFGDPSTKVRFAIKDGRDLIGGEPGPWKRNASIEYAIGLAVRNMVAEYDIAGNTYGPNYVCETKLYLVAAPPPDPPIE